MSDPVKVPDAPNTPSPTKSTAPAPDIIAAVLEEFRKATAEDPVTHKPGWQTTEFWSHLGILALGAGLVAYGILHDNNLAMGFGGALVGVDGAIYKVVRMAVKKAPPSA